MLVRPAEEAIPKVVLNLPPTPSLEIAPALPTPKIKFFTGNSESSLSRFYLLVLMLMLPFLVLPVSQPSTPSTPSYEPSSFLNNGLPSPAIRLTLNRPPAHAPPAIPPPKKKKEKAVQKAQKSGMTATELIVCRKLLQKMVSRAFRFIGRTVTDLLHSLLFPQDRQQELGFLPRACGSDSRRSHRVRPPRLFSFSSCFSRGALAHDTPFPSSTPFSYFTVIRNPMDLSTVRAKLEDGQYQDRFAFRDDVHLIASNAILYNQPNSAIGKMSEKFASYFDKRESFFLSRFFLTASSRNADRPRRLAWFFLFSRMGDDRRLVSTLTFLSCLFD